MAAVHSGPVPSSAMHLTEAPGQMEASAPPFLPADHWWAVSSTVSRFPGPRFDCMEPEMQRQMIREVHRQQSIFRGSPPPQTAQPAYGRPAGTSREAASASHL